MELFLNLLRHAIGMSYLSHFACLQVTYLRPVIVIWSSKIPLKT